MTVWVVLADDGKEGLEFINEIVGGAIPREFIPASHNGGRV